MFTFIEVGLQLLHKIPILEGLKFAKSTSLILFITMLLMLVYTNHVCLYTNKQIICLILTRGNLILNKKIYDLIYELKTIYNRPLLALTPCYILWSAFVTE